MADQKYSRVIVDGGDGSGKSTLVERLRRMGFDAQDRGRATQMTMDGSVTPEPDALYIILDVPVEVAIERLRHAGKPMDEEWHQPDSLAHYRERYREVVKQIPDAVLLDADQPMDLMVAAALNVLSDHRVPRTLRRRRSD